MSDMNTRVAEVEAIIRQFLPKEEGYQKTILEALNYSILVGGKRLRPLIMLETYKMLGGDPAKGDIQAMMTAIEMIHTSSLVHDDLPCMDNDTFRRGKHTTWYAYGEDMGVLAGDALLTYAFEVAAGAFATTEHPERLGEAIRILANKTGIFGMIGGQTLDVELTDKAMNKHQLDFIFRLKTGALLEASMMIGAVLAGADKKTVAIMEKVAHLVGMAFQIRDDVLDLISTTETLGKPVHSDERNNKTTYVTLYGMEQANADVKALSEEAVSLLHQYDNSTFLENLFTDMIHRDK